jgi:hypothetical protein
MPRSFDLSADYRYTVEQVHLAFSDEHYWLARLNDSGADAVTLDSMTVNADGGVEIATTQALRPDRLPALVTQFHRGELRIVRNEKWSPVRGGEASAVFSGAVPGAPVSVRGRAALEPTPSGSRLVFNATVEVSVPMVGGKIEGFIGSQLAELVIAEQRFTTVWLTENA